MTDNPKGNKFCEQCGTQLQQSCSRCGHDVAPAARFCGNCGQAAGSGPHEAAAPKWGELKLATVLFADIVSSTELVATLDPEQAMARLRPAVLRMRHSVERFGGTVVRTLGDGVMAIFGVPHTLEGHALLACQAAQHMQQAFRSDASGLSIRVGLHSGEVASDPDDGEDGRGGGAHGLTIHLASRVVALAQPGETCLTEACRVIAGGGCTTRARGPQSLKGIPQPVDVHALVDVAVATHRTRAVLSTFRGREAEFARLNRTIDEGADARVRVVGISGDPGTGKSRLCHEFAQACAEKGLQVHRIRAQLYGHALPLQPILELFRVHFFHIAQDEDPLVVRNRIAQRFGADMPQPDDLDLLCDFLGIATGRKSGVALQPRVRQARLVALVKTLVRQEADTRRVIVIEDLHWLDEGSEEFVAAMVDAVVGTRTVLLLNYRRSYRCPWKSLPQFEEMALAELPAQDMQGLVAEALGADTSALHVRDLVCRRAAGNPFFAEELVHMLLESRLVVPGQSVGEAQVEAIERALPATVQAVLGARLDRIGEPEKTLLQMCAIIGKEIPLAVLQHVAHPLAAEIAAGVEGLCEAGLILPQASTRGRSFAFRHPLIQEVAYNAQLKVRRGPLHSKVAQAMELYYADQLGEYAALIGYHYEQAGEFVPAARHNAKAAAWVGSTNSAQAIKHWRKVRSLLKDQPPGAESDRLRMLAGGKLAWLGWREGMTPDEVKPLLAEAMALARDADLRQAQLLLLAEGRILHANGESAQLYVERLEQALALAPQQDVARAVTLKAALSQAYGWAGLLREAIAANDDAYANLAHVDPVDSEFVGFEIEQWVLALRARLLTRLGRIEEARACLDRLLGTMGTSADPVIVQMPHYAYVELAEALGDEALAVKHQERVSGIAAKHAAPYIRVFALNAEAIVHRMRDAHAQAATALREALALVRGGRVAVEFETEIMAHLAECLLALDDTEAANELAQHTASLSRQRGHRLALCRALISAHRAGGGAAGGTSSHEGEIRDLLHLTGMHGYTMEGRTRTASGAAAPLH